MCLNQSGEDGIGQRELEEVFGDLIFDLICLEAVYLTNKTSLDICMNMLT